ncbi:O-antigen ligase family protein [Oceanithermus desulfurans]|uniref:Polymerase n=2 Tax=Oceanithermus desulfurans TaxID=227924 RepID=A0A511RLT2_9DEIN|nr:O-antigen ligase family protein [Oceanithermus desulfurans]MBB6030553.1 O-antigen ligase [Oceanithermus desulfurans]GEM90037.1 polymerase [Oceanithermus desulfurans NBRC 100063]
MRSRLAWLIALVPVFPPLYLAAFAALRYWRALGPLARGVALFYLGTQLAAALLTPEPLVSVPLALLRGLFVLALVLAGVRLADPRWLHYLLAGLAVVYLLAFWTSYDAFGAQFLARRLVHPYYTTVSIGLAGALGVLLALDWRGPAVWRLGVGLLALLALAFSGSRGAMAVLVVGVVIGAVVKSGRFAWGAATAGALATAVYVIGSLGQHVSSLARLLSLNLSGRDRVWEGALEAIRSYPWGGVGPYQLGPWLGYLYKQGCNLWVGARYLGLGCPGWLEPFYGAWLIAHNLLLHALGETGVVGTLGFLSLLALLGYAAVRSREPLLVAIFFGYLVMSLVDNPMAVPSLHLAEVFWVAGGMALARSGLAVALEQGGAVDVDERRPDPL